MGRAQRRAKSRAAAKLEQTANASASPPTAEPIHRIADERPETPAETARRIYRAGGKPEHRRKTGRRASEQRLKWREGRQ